MSAMGELNFFLGQQVLQKKDDIFLLQDKYVGDILKKFGYSDVRSANTPMDKENPWGKDGPGKDVKLHLYRSMIRSLMYLTVSRPDIMFAVCACARHQVTPKECHLYAVKRIFRYLKGHPKLGLWYPKESPFDLVAYSDSDYGGTTQDRKLTTGGCQFLGRRLISWQCKKHTFVATSTTEAEYVAAASGCGQILWIQNQMLDYGYNFMNIKIYIDNNNAICIVKNPVYHSKTKHIEIRHHFIRDCFEKKLINVDHIHTDDNVADLLIKPFDVRRFQYLVFWSTARIETTNEGTKILATVDGNPKTISESSLRRHLKLNDAKGISSLPDVELFENLALMGYNILPNQKFTFQKEIPTLRQYSRRATWIAQSKALPTTADELASLLKDVSQGEAFPTVSGLEEGHDRENIIKTSALPHDSTPRARIKLLEDKDKGSIKLSGEDAPIKGRSLETGEEAGVERSTKRGSNDIEEMVNVLTSVDAVNILTSGVQAVSVPPVAKVSTVGVPTGSGLVPTVSAIFTTASVVTPYSRRPREILAKDKEMEDEMAREDQRLNEQIARDAEIARIHAEEELKMMIDGLDRNNEMIVKHLHEGMTLEEIREKFIHVWKQIKDFVLMASKEEGERVKRKGLKLEQRSAKKIKTSEDVSEEDLKEMMQLVPMEEVYVEALQVKHPIIDWEIYREGKRDYWKIIRLGGHTAVYQFFVDMLKQLDREDLNQLWTLVKEILSIRQASSDKEKELWVKLKRLFKPDFEDQLWTHTQALMHDPLEWRLYDTCGVHHVFTKDQEIFMLVERDYLLRRGLDIVMISTKLQASFRIAFGVKHSYKVSHIVTLRLLRVTITLSLKVVDPNLLGTT
nr:putative ribonuclease H-like domain-containing protein [Tanacetum cinerariifolium]